MSENVNSSQENRVPWWRKLTLQDIGTASIVIVGLIGGLLIRIWGPKLEPLYSAIFLGLGIAAFVYQFLGGISKETSFTIPGGVKLGGSLAALIAVTYFFNAILVEQRQWTPPEKLILSFTKGQYLIEQDITVKPRKLKDLIPIKDGCFELTLKDLQASDGIIWIKYKRPPETEEVNPNDIFVTYKPYIPKITLNLDFLDKIGLPVGPSRGITLLFYRKKGMAKEIIEDDRLFIENDRHMKIYHEDGEYRLPPVFFKDEGHIQIKRDLSEEIKSKNPKKIKTVEPAPIQIKHLQCKIDPPQIMIYLDNY